MDKIIIKIKQIGRIGQKTVSKLAKPEIVKICDEKLEKYYSRLK